MEITQEIALVEFDGLRIIDEVNFKMDKSYRPDTRLGIILFYREKYGWNNVIMSDENVLEFAKGEYIDSNTIMMSNDDDDICLYLQCKTKEEIINRLTPFYI